MDLLLGLTPPYTHQIIAENISATGLIDGNPLNINMGPNPTDGQIIISITPDQDVKIQTTLYSYLGVKIIEFDQVELSRKAQVTLNYTFSEIPDGLYFMTFKWISDGKQRSFIKKLILAK